MTIEEFEKESPTTLVEFIRECRADNKWDAPEWWWWKALAEWAQSPPDSAPRHLRKRV